MLRHGSGRDIRSYVMKNKKQIQKAFKEINDRHLRVFKIYNSPIDMGYTEEHLFAQLKWLERFAGFIQALQWVLNDDAELPSQYTAIPDV